MNSYSVLARSYDQLTADVDYEGLADYLERHFARAGRPVHTVLDLACGTASLTCVLAERGYETIGADLSADMLSVAAEKAEKVRGEKPVLIQQSMDQLDLYGTVDACVCCLDSVNYVTKPRLLQRAFQRVYTFLAPGGVFLFDCRTPEAMAAMDGQVYLDETDDLFCVWRVEYSRRSRVCFYGLDLFRREQNLWRRDREIHREFAYTPAELTQFLHQAGFRSIRQYGDRVLRKPVPRDTRIFFVAGKER